MNNFFNVIFSCQKTKFFSGALEENCDMPQQGEMETDWENITTHCKRALPIRLQNLLQAGSDNQQLYKDLASCFETETTDYEYDYETGKSPPSEVTITGVDYSCLEPHQKSLGMTAYDAFLVRRILNGTDQQITEAKLITGFSDPRTVKEYNKGPILWHEPYERDLAHLVAKMMLILDG